MDTNAQVEFVKSKLSSMLNKKVVYGVSDFVIEDYKMQDINTFVIHVSDRDKPFSFTVERAVDFARECKLINGSLRSDEKITAKNDDNNEMALSTDNLAEKLKRTVLECIDKVRSDPKYIPQANAINAQIQTLLNLKRLEIENEKLKRLLAGRK